MIMRLFWTRTKISKIWMRDQLEIVKGILGRTGVILLFALDLVHLRRMRTIRGRRFSDEVLANTPVLVHEELPMLALQVFTDVGVPVVPPVIDQPV